VAVKLVQVNLTDERQLDWSTGGDAQYIRTCCVAL